MPLEAKLPVAPKALEYFWSRERILRGLATKIKEKREKLPMTPAELASKTGVPVEKIFGLETGMPVASTQISDILGILKGLGLWVNQVTYFYTSPRWARYKGHMTYWENKLSDPDAKKLVALCDLEPELEPCIVLDTYIRAKALDEALGNPALA